MEIKLKYGNNPHQQFARVLMDDENPPFRVVNGRPGFINILDALGAWQLARDLKRATGKPGAASFKHVSPAGAAIARPLSEGFRVAQMIPEKEDLSPVAEAYARARGGDRMSSFGDVAAVSEQVDVSLARLLKREVSDALVAPGFDDDALAILREKKGGNYLLLQMNRDYEAPDIERREVMGVRLEQTQNKVQIGREALHQVVSKKTEIPEDVAETIMVGAVALKYTQSNSVCVAYDGQAIGIGAGQQSRVHCTRLACRKADKWMLQLHPRVLDLTFKSGLARPVMTNTVDRFLLWDELADAEREAMLENLAGRPEPLGREERADWIGQFEGNCLCSDAFFPFRDSIDRASRSSVDYVWQTGGSARDEEVTAAADHYGMVMIHSGLRLFLH